MDLLKSIEVFREVCKQLSFSKAADRLNLVPSAVSRQISELEKYLGVRLLQRSTRSISLTEEGRHYLQKMERISQSVRELRNLAGDGDHIEDHIRLTAPPLLGPQFLNDALISYLQQYPNVSFSTTLINREINLIEEGYDLALRVGELEDSNQIARAIGKFSLSMVASPSYIKTHGKPKHPKDLVEHHCLINTLTQSPRRWRFQDGSRKFSIKVDGRYEANDDMLLQALVRSGLGIAYLPTYFVYEGINKGELVPILEAFILDSLPISVLYPSRQLLSTAKRILIEHLINHAEQHPFSCL